MLISKTKKYNSGSINNSSDIHKKIELLLNRLYFLIIKINIKMEKSKFDKEITKVIGTKINKDEGIERKRCLQLLNKMKKFVENPTIEPTQISSIGNLLPRFNKHYSTGCSELDDFIQDFNKNNSSSKIEVVSKKVSHIDALIDKENKKVEYYLNNFRSWL